MSTTHDTLTPEAIGHAIDRARLTRPLVFIIAVAAAGFFFDSFDIVILSYALPSIAKEFHLVAKEVGLIGSAGLAGMGVGSWAWGWAADRWGRRMVFAATVLMFSVFTGLTGLAFSMGLLIGGRFLTGLGLGGMVPIDGALVAEYAPARIRGRVSAALPLCWPIGIFAAAGVSLLVVPTIGWRWLFAIGIVPAILVFFIRRNIPESPRWLAARGRTAEARQSLAYVGIDAEDLSRAMRETADRPVAPRHALPRLRDLFRPEYARRVVQTWVMWFCSNFAASTFSVWLPTIYANIYHIQLTKTLTYTFIIAGTSVVGRICGFVLIDKVGRKPLIVTGYTVAAFAALQFTMASSEMSLVLVAMFYAFFADIGSMAMTVYTPEVYPLRIRGYAASAAMGVGRFGGMFAPATIGLFISPETVVYVWVLMAGCQFTSGMISLWLARETRGQNLEIASSFTPATVPAQAHRTRSA